MQHLVALPESRGCLAFLDAQNRRLRAATAWWLSTGRIGRYPGLKPGHRRGEIRMKFLHAADIHLDSAMAGISRDSGIPAHVTAGCTRRALENLVGLAIAEDVAFVVIAGDIFDADWRDYSTGLFFAQQMRRLGRPCIVVRGNHDAQSVIIKRLQLPPNVREFSSRTAQSFPLNECNVMLHGRSFPDRAVPEDLSASYPDPAQGWLNIGVLHTSAEDPGGRHDRYAPCSVEALQAKGYDYWALGHIHDRRILGEKPFVVFPGNLQGRHPNETGAKGAVLVEVRDREIVGAPEFRALDVLRWAALTVSLIGVEDMAGLAARVGDSITTESAAAEGRPVIARLMLTGTTSLHPALLADPKAVEAECRNVAIARGADFYVQSVRIGTQPPHAGDTGDALALLHANFAEVLDDPAVTERLLAEFSALAQQIPRGTATRDASGVPRDLDALRALAPEAWEIVAHTLSAGGTS
jgi:DNA repair protein SbcD/Mre11